MKNKLSNGQLFDKLGLFIRHKQKMKYKSFHDIAEAHTEPRLQIEPHDMAEVVEKSEEKTWRNESAVSTYATVGSSG